MAGLELPVRAGADGLDRRIRWVHISELPDPTRWLTGGEVLLTSGMALLEPEEQAAYVHRLADHRVAALGFGTGLGHDSVPTALLEAAATRGFPVFEVGYDVPFIAITEAASTRLINDGYAVARRALAAQERLERIVLSQRGIGAIAQALAGLLDGQVEVLDGHGRRLALASSHAELPPPGGGGARLAVHAGAERPGRRSPDAWLVGTKHDGPLSDFDRLLLRQAVTIVGLELLRGRVAEDTERRLAGDVLTALMSGDLAGPELARRLAPFGLAGSVAVLVAGVDPGPALSLAGERGLIAAHGELIVALVPGREEAALLALGTSVSERIGAVVGVGRSAELGRLRRGVHEARCAYESIALGLRDGVEAPAGPRVASYRDLGSHQLLLALQEDAALALFCDSVLGAIERAERSYGDELLRSLEAFIEENGQWERAAKRLFCHRHTLRYRIRRIEELTGRDLGSARDRIEFWLALRGRELLS